MGNQMGKDTQNRILLLENKISTDIGMATDKKQDKDIVKSTKKSSPFTATRSNDNGCVLLFIRYPGQQYESGHAEQNFTVRK